MASIIYIVEILILFVTIGFLIYKYFTRDFDYWKKRNVPYIKPLPFFGNYFEAVTFRTNLGHLLAKLYNQFNTPYFGIFVLNNPTLVIKSPELIKSILIKDFDHFQNRTVLSDEKCDSVFSNTLFAVHNPRWKSLRSKATPVFSSGKVKNMFSLIDSCAEEMNSYIKKHLNESSIEAKEVCSKYTTDVIVTCAFGINGNSFKSQNAEFRNVGRQMFDFQWETAIRQSGYVLLPFVVRMLRISFFKPSITNFLRDVFWRTIKLREETNVKRNDVIDTVIELIKQEDPKKSDFAGDRVLAMAFQFFNAGFETTGSTVAFALYELCLAPDIQYKLRAEIKEVVSNHGGFTYEAIQDMKYLHMVICETLRKYPVIPFMDRLCAKDYKVPNSDLVIEKGTNVYISTFGLSYDPKYYSEPEKFDPERFTEENKRSLPPCTYMPFGEGPRNCIGERFGLLVTKLGVARILSEYELERTSDTPVPLQIETKTIFVASRVGLPMKFKKLVSDAVY